MKSLILLSVFILSLVETNSAFAKTQVKMLPAYFQVKKVASKKFSFEYCEEGYCRPIGNPKGYDAETFTTMGKACNHRGNTYPFATNILKGATILIAAKLTGGLALTVGLGGMAAVDGIFNSSHDYAADQFAADIIENMPKDEDVNFELPRAEFNQLYDGLIACHDYYDNTPGVWLEDCERSFQCKKNLVKGLPFTDDLIKKYSAYYLYQIKIDFEKTNW